MALLRTFKELSAGHKELADLLDFIWAGGREEEWICCAIIALTCENPQEPLTGQALWDRIADLYEYVPGVPRSFNLLYEVSDKADELKQLAAEIAARPTIQEFLREQATTEAIRASQGYQSTAA